MRLLLAEDEQMLSDALVEILTHHNYSVDAVYNGQDALDYLENGNYDGAILDIMMPKLDGLTVLRRLRAGGSTIPILMLTAKSEIDDRVTGLDSGADDYLTKPFATKELLARIRSMTRRQPELQDTVLRVGALALDRTDYVLSGPGGSIRLSNREFQMMEMLMGNSRQVIPTERFLEKVWGYDSEAEINVVWVYISGLRKKLLGLDAGVQIRAARGVGYSLEASV
ncbi:response regulator transcription factor [Oscillibacter sp.]|uniref:response regulator transcription factor n=1 Tax=Oscillibacter sp. TaxID=1945593 RepID=UPI0026159D16|nr:response regulator transcription factor [Oscillibacter sp.]MDD3347825.1 response regulator transcription factor [Oscillibacter sp.]